MRAVLRYWTKTHSIISAGMGLFGILCFMLLSSSAWPDSEEWVAYLFLSLVVAPPIASLIDCYQSFWEDRVIFRKK